MAKEKIRPRLTQEEYDLVLRHRALSEECDIAGIDINDVNYYWYKSEKFSINSSVNATKDYNALVNDIIERQKQYSPSYRKYKRNKVEDGHLLIIDPADVHIGKLVSSTEVGDTYNVDIAAKRFKDGVKGVLDKSSGFNIDKIVMIGGNDILHVDSPKNTTTSGTHQDTDGMWYDNFLVAKKCYVEALELLISIADVEFVYCPSNHDYMTGYFLSKVLETWFRNSKNISFKTTMAHRKYFTYHSNLIGVTHGDGAKINDLPMLMASEAEHWSKCTNRYIYTHHIHHKMSKDYIGVTIESLRSPSGTDSWHHRNGYQHVPKAIEGFIHSKDFGQVARLTHLFK